MLFSLQVMATGRTVSMEVTDMDLTVMPAPTLVMPDTDTVDTSKKEHHFPHP